jgi:hypothetical protein
MEYWNIGLKKKYSFTLLHPSNIPLFQMDGCPYKKSEGFPSPFLYGHPFIWNNGMLEGWNNVKEYFFFNPILQYSIVPFFLWEQACGDFLKN